MSKLFLLIAILFSTTTFCQTDSLDTIFLNNGDVIKGKVIIVKQNVVEFLEHSTSILYEYEKTKIKLINLANGKTLTFDNQNIQSPNSNDTLITSQQVSNGTRVGVGIGFLYALKSENYESGTGVNLLLKIRFPSILSLMFNFGYYTADTKVDLLSKASTSFILPELSLLFESKKGVVQPYVGLGLGYYIIDNSLDEQLVQSVQQLGFGIEEEIESGIGFEVRGGLNIMFAQNVGLIFDMKYWIYNPKVNSKVYQTYPYQEYSVQNEIQLNNFSFIIGLEANL